MIHNDFEQVSYDDLGAAANNSTLGSAARWIGFLAMIVLTIFTAVHAINLASWHWASMPEAGDIYAWIRIGGVILVEVFALVTGIMLLTHRIRARQAPLAMVIEIAWLAFAALNLISSFAVERTGQIPMFVDSWVTYGLPISAIVMGALFWIMMRLDPDIRRASNEAEIREAFLATRHNARLEVLASPQMRQVIRQMTWQQLSPEIGRQLNLSEEQIKNLVEQAPDLLDMRNVQGVLFQPAPPAQTQSENGRRRGALTR